MPRKPININNQIDESKYINLKNSFLSNFSKCAHSPYSEKITGNRFQFLQLVTLPEKGMAGQQLPVLLSSVFIFCFKIRRRYKKM